MHMKSLGQFAYANRMLTAGDNFPVRKRDARLLQALGRAEYLTKSDEPDDEPEKKPKRRRRKAEEK